MLILLCSKLLFLFSLDPVSFSIKSKEDTTPTSLKPALPIEHSSDEENVSNEQDSSTTPTIFPQPSSNNTSLNHSITDVDQSDSFLRDAMLEQQNLHEKKLVKRGTIDL